MLEFLTASKDDAIVIIKDDHEKVKDLFKQFEHTDDLRSKKRIAAEAIMELKIHAEIEEKIFYPTVRAQLKKEMMNEADEEHHVAKLLIAELDNMLATDDHWEAKFTVLSENIRHHIREEESDMLPSARRLDIDFELVGKKMLMMKELLKKNGIPESDEEKMIKGKKARADSPAKAAKKKLTAKPVRAKSGGNGSYTSSSRPKVKAKTHTAAKRRKA